MKGILLQKKKEALAALYTGDSIAFSYYLDSVKLKIQGQWREAGDKLVKSAEFYYNIKMLIESATIYYEAGDCYLKVDKSEAIQSFRRSVKAYCDIGRFDIAGRIERKIGYIHYRIMHWEDAYSHFRKASDFFSGDRDLDQSDLCLEKAAECAVYLNNYTDAQGIYEIIAKSCINTNLRRFQSCRKLLKAIFCMFGKYVPIEDEIPLIVNGKGGIQKHLDKLKEQQQQNPVLGSIETTGPGNSSLTTRNSIRSDDDNSSIRTAETRHDNFPPTTGANLPPLGSPAPTTNGNTVATTPGAASTPGGGPAPAISINSIASDDQSTQTKTSYAESFQPQGKKSMSALSFQGMKQDQIIKKLPDDAKYHHGLPRQWQYNMPEILKLKYDEIEERCEYYCIIDYLFKCSKEYFFIKNLLKYRRECNYFEFIDHIYYWNNIYPLDEISLILLKYSILEMQKESENHKIAKLNIEVNNAIRNRRNKNFSG
eukprot:gene1488-1576_t